MTRGARPKPRSARQPDPAPTAEALLRAALQHHQAGRLAAAEDAYRRILALDPAQPDALLLLGTMAWQQGQSGRARDLVGRAAAVAPDTAPFQANLGKMWLMLGQPDAALARLRRAVALDAGMLEAQKCLGSAWQRLGRIAEAEACFRTALALQPEDAEAQNSLGNLFHAQGQWETAAACYQQALAVHPDYAESLVNLGGTLRRLGRLAEAEACLTRAIALNPALELAHFNLAEVLREQDRIEAAVASYRQAAALNPQREIAHHNLGAMHLRLAQHQDAIACFHTALRLQPGLAEAHNNLGMALLATGALPEGWREHEWRWQVSPNAEVRRGFAQPQWQGEAAEGRTLLIHAEQGFGDTLQFCRLAPLARARFLRVILEVPPPLKRLLQGLRGIDLVIATGDTLPSFDLHCPMLSLPLALGLTLDSIPGATPYLFADRAEAAAWAARLAPATAAGPRIGLVWAGSPRTQFPAAAAIDRRRSIPLEQLAPLFGVPGVQFFSLQTGGVPAGCAFPLIDPMAEMRDFADTAALVANLDLVVSVDTAVAHLAGALGRPVCLLDRFDHCWRWLAGRADSPWYPTLRIYRQPRPGDWDPVVAAVAADLQALSEAWHAMRATLHGTARAGRDQAAKRTLRRAAQADATPGRFRGASPGMSAGMSPGMSPGTDPGMSPGMSRGMPPGTDPGTDPGMSPGIDPALFSAARQHHAAGRLAEAEHACRQLLSAEPRHADGLHLLGLVAYQSGRLTQALGLIEQAIAIVPSRAMFHANLGAVLAEFGRVGEAVACHRHALALDPGLADAQRYLGQALRRLGRLDEAAACFRALAALRPDDAEAHRALGTILMEQARHDEAATCLRAVLAIAPNDVSAHHNLGTALYRQHALDDAAASYRRALALDPACEEALANLGNVLREQGRFHDAIACYRAALALRPDRALTWNWLGAAQYSLEVLDEAAEAFRDAIRLQPDYAHAHQNLGVTLMRLGRPAAAIERFRTAIGLQPDHAEAHNNLGMALLTVGAMPEGWAEYEWRWQVKPGELSRRDFAQPQWTGQPAQGLTVLIHAEQGHGDTLQFCRLAPLVQARGLRVIMQVPAGLVRVLRSLPGVDRLVTSDETPPPFDLHCPMLSLPAALRLTVAGIPGTTPYLHADPADVAAWQGRLASGGQGPRVGVAWAGGFRPDWPVAVATDQRRSIAPERLAGLFAVPGVQFCSLQKDRPVPAGLPLIDHMPQMRDFADTAALIANLDLVVSVDTAVAHLAGALGRPVCLLDRFDHCWRWLAGRRDSPWYPTLRIYRQPAAGDWEAVVQEVAADLRLLAEAWHRVRAGSSSA